MLFRKIAKKLREAGINAKYRRGKTFMDAMDQLAKEENQHTCICSVSDNPNVKYVDGRCPIHGIPLQVERRDGHKALP